MGRWDTRMKQLIGIKPQDFVSWLVPDAELINELSEELHGRDLDTDKLYKFVCAVSCCCCTSNSNGALNVKWPCVSGSIMYWQRLHMNSRCSRS